MAMQDQYTVSTSKEAQNASFTLVPQESQASTQAELAQMASVLKLVGKQAKSSTEQASSMVDSGDSSGALPDSLAQVTLMLQMLQVKITEASRNKTEMDADISQSQITLSQQNLDQVNSQLQELQEEQQKSKTTSFWSSFAEYLVSALTIVVAAVTLNPALMVMAVVSTTMLVASQTGALQKATTFVAGELSGILGQKAANIVAAVAVTLAVVVATVALCPTSALEAATDGVEEVGEDAAATGDAAAEGLDAAGADTAEADANNALSQQEGDQEVSKLSKAWDGIKSGAKSVYENNPFSKLSAKTNLAIMAGAGAVQQTGLAQSIGACCSNSDEVTEGLEIAFAIMGGLASMGSGAALMKAASAAEGLEEADETMTKFQKAMSKLKGYLGGVTTEQVVSVALGTQVVAQLAEGIASIEFGEAMKKQGEIQKALAPLQANQELLQVATSMSSQGTKEDEEQASTAIQALAMGPNAISNMLAGGRAFANSFATHSPV